MVEPQQADARSGRGAPPAPGASLVSIRREWTARAVHRTLGEKRPVRYRPDGKPEIDGASVSASHGAGVTLAVTGKGMLGCDVQAVRDLPDDDSLLGEHAALARFVAGETGETVPVARARVWAALECLRKAGSAVVGQATFDGRPGPGWVTFTVGQSRTATFATSLATIDGEVVFAVQTEQRG